MGSARTTSRRPRSNRSGRTPNRGGRHRPDPRLPLGGGLAFARLGGRLPWGQKGSNIHRSDADAGMSITLRSLPDTVAHTAGGNPNSCEFPHRMPARSDLQDPRRSRIAGSETGIFLPSIGTGSDPCWYPPPAMPQVRPPDQGRRAAVPGAFPTERPVSWRHS